MGVRTATRQRRRGVEGAGRESGQALILALGGAFVLIAGALALVAIAGAVTGKGRVQRAADLAAISAARSMRDDLPRLLSPPTLAQRPAEPGPPREGRLSGAGAGGGGRRRARRTGSTRTACGSASPTEPPSRRCGRRRASSRDLELGASAARSRRRRWPKRPRRSAPAAATPAMASGGGYSGPLVYRTGRGDAARRRRRLRPDGRAAAAAPASPCSSSPGFRSDAEQAALFAAHPDPNWVAPPGHSLHRCATELDLGPESAYAWLAANAEPLRLRPALLAGRPGTTASTPARRPARRRATRSSGGWGDGAVAGAGGLPGFVPARFRAPLLRRGRRAGTSPPRCSRRS